MSWEYIFLINDFTFVLIQSAHTEFHFVCLVPNGIILYVLFCNLPFASPVGFGDDTHESEPLGSIPFLMDIPIVSHDKSTVSTSSTWAAPT